MKQLSKTNAKATMKPPYFCPKCNRKTLNIIKVKTKYQPRKGVMFRGRCGCGFITVPIAGPDKVDVYCRIMDLFRAGHLVVPIQR